MSHPITSNNCSNLCLFTLVDQFSFENAPSHVFSWLFLLPSLTETKQLLARQSRKNRPTWLRRRPHMDANNGLQDSTLFTSGWQTYPLSLAHEEQYVVRSTANCPVHPISWKKGPQANSAEGLPFQLPCLLPQLSLAHQSSKKQSLSANSSKNSEDSRCSDHTKPS